MMSRHRDLVVTLAQVLCRLQIVAPDVVTSISCRDINLMNCSFQLMPSDVATLAQVFCSLGLIVHDVATSISCRDISLCLWRFHWLLLMSRLQSSVATTASVESSSFFQTCRSFKAIHMSQQHDVVATSLS